MVRKPSLHREHLPNECCKYQMWETKSRPSKYPSDEAASKCHAWVNKQSYRFSHLPAKEKGLEKSTRKDSQAHQ
uniref:Uncharacterized protein n=1 Tax=Solanum tuberosum TaxID=4113 RepID=M1A6S5_SOLTU